MDNNHNCGPHFPPMLAIPESFEECLSYGQRQLVLYKMIQDLDERVTALEGTQPQSEDNSENEEESQNEEDPQV